MNGMYTADVTLEMLRGDVIDIVLGTVFLTIGATGCAIAAIRWRRGVRILVWWGIFSRDVRPPKTGADAHDFDGSAALPQVCRALCEYGGHVPALDICLVRLARAEPGQTQGPRPTGNLGRVSDCSGGYGHVRRRRPSQQMDVLQQPARGSSHDCPVSCRAGSKILQVPRDTPSPRSGRWYAHFCVGGAVHQLGDRAALSPTAFGGLVGLCRPSICAGIRSFGDTVYGRATSAFHRDGTGDGAADTVLNSSGESSRV